MKFDSLVRQILNEDHFKIGEHVTYKGNRAKVVKQVGEDGKPHKYVVTWKDEDGKECSEVVSPSHLKTVAS